MRSAPARGGDARSRRLRVEPACAGVRRLRRGLRAVGQGEQGEPAEAAQRADGVPVVGAGAAAVGRALPGAGSPRRGQAALWPSERSVRLSQEKLNTRFADYRDALGLPDELSLHCLRHSYVTHLIEDGYDPLFVQQQVGHSYASTTALYTSVSSDFRHSHAAHGARRQRAPGPAAKRGGWGVIESGSWIFTGICAS